MGTWAKKGTSENVEPGRKTFGAPVNLTLMGSHRSFSLVLDVLARSFFPTFPLEILPSGTKASSC